MNRATISFSTLKTCLRKTCALGEEVLGERVAVPLVQSNTILHSEEIMKISMRIMPRSKNEKYIVCITAAGTSSIPFMVDDLPQGEKGQQIRKMSMSFSSNTASNRETGFP